MGMGDGRPAGRAAGVAGLGLGLLWTFDIWLNLVGAHLPLLSFVFRYILVFLFDFYFY